MKTISLKQVAQSQEQMKTNSFNTDLFAGDRENLEQFDNQAYSYVDLLTTDHAHDKGEHDKLVETVIAVGHESDFYLVTAVTSSFNGETQVSYSEQPLTLAGFNFFTKNTEVDTDIYDNYLQSQGFDFTLEDVKTLGIYLADYNCTTLSFFDEDENKYYITVNGKGQLSKITKKLSGKKVNSKNSLSSAFGF